MEFFFFSNDAWISFIVPKYLFRKYFETNIFSNCITKVTNVHVERIIIGETCQILFMQLNFPSKWNLVFV